MDSARAISQFPHLHTPSKPVLGYMVFPGEQVADRIAPTVASAQFAQCHSHFCDPSAQKNNRHF